MTDDELKTLIDRLANTLQTTLLLAADLKQGATASRLRASGGTLMSSRFQARR